MPHHAVILVPHPMASRPPEQVEAVARAAFPKILAALTAPAYEPVATFPVRVENGVIQVRDDRWD